MSENEYHAFRAIGSLVDYKCNKFFEMLKTKGLVDEKVEFRDLWGDFIDSSPNLESEIFDKIDRVVYHSKRHQESKRKDTLKTAYHYFFETEKPILENDPDCQGFSEKQISAKLKDIWRDLDDHEKIRYADRVSGKKLYSEYVREWRLKKGEGDGEGGGEGDVVCEDLCEDLKKVNLDEKKSSKKETEVEFKKFLVSTENQYLKNGKEMFRILDSKEGLVEEDILKKIEKNTVKTLHLIMKRFIGVKSVSKYKKDDAVSIVSNAIDFE